MTKCSAFNCDNQGIHLFPRDIKRRKKWESALRIRNFKASNTARLCAAHFVEEDYYGQSKYTNYAPLAKFLKKTAVPTVFSFTKKKQTRAALERQHRLERRSRKKSKTNLAKSDEGDPLETEIDPLLLVKFEEEEFINESSSIEACSPTPEYSSIATQVDTKLFYGSIDSRKSDDTFIEFYTGFETYRKFHTVYSILRPMVHKLKSCENNVINLSTEDQFFMTMIKLWQNKCNYELSMFYDICESTVSTIFIAWVNFIYQLWAKIDIWPKEEFIHYYLPKIFKKFDLNIEVMSGGTLIKVQNLKNSKSQKVSSDNQKNADESKILVGAIPGRQSMSDQLTELRDLLSKSESSGRDKFADKSEQIEKILGLTTNYKIVQNALDPSYVPIASKIFFVCFMCCYFRECSSR